MNNKERMLAVISDQAVDRIPYVPRLDLWYRANARAGSLPPKYKNASLIDMVDDYLPVIDHLYLPFNPSL